nr:MAG TPA: hypothetical protein [Caudoviricetes sp.]
MIAYTWLLFVYGDYCRSSSHRQRFGGTYDPSITIIYFKACGRATTRRG